MMENLFIKLALSLETPQIPGIGFVSFPTVINDSCRWLQAHDNTFVTKTTQVIFEY